MVKIASNKNIKGITVEIGGDVQGLDKALDSVDNKSKDLSSELKQVNKLLKLDPDNVVLLAQKQKILSEQVENSAEKLEKLKSVQDQIERQYASGEIDEGAYRRFQREIEDTEIALKRANDQIDNTSKNMDKVEDKTTTFGSKLKSAAKTAATAFKAAAAAAAAVGTALVKTSLDAATYADEILTTSTNTGLSTEYLQAYAYAAELVDVDLKTMTTSMAKNIKSMTNAQKGTEDYVNAYKKLGVKVADSNGALRDSEEVYWDVIDALGKIDDETERDSISMQIFGKSAQELNSLIAVGSEGLKEYAAEADEMGAVLDEKTLSSLGDLDDSFQRLQASSTAWRNQIGAIFAPEITTAINKITAFVTKNMPKITSFLKSAKKYVSSFLPSIKSIYDSGKKIVKTVGSIFGDLLKKIAPTLKNILKVAGNIIKIVSPALEGIYGMLTPILTVISKITQGASWLVNGVLDITAALFGGTGSANEFASAVGLLSDEWGNLRDESSENIQIMADEEAKTDYLISALDRLVDENGKVIGSKDELAAVISKLKQQGYDVEYDAIKNQISGYQELRTEIQKTYDQKKYESRMEVLEPLYDEAKENVTAAYNAWLEADAAYKAELERLEAEPWSTDINTAPLKESLDEAEQLYKQYVDTINTYETASTLDLSGETSAAVEVLDEYYYAFVDTSSAASQYMQKTSSDLETLKNDFNNSLTGLMLAATKWGVGEYTDVAEAQVEDLAQRLREAGYNIPDDISEGILNGSYKINDIMTDLGNQTVNGLIISIDGGSEKISTAGSNMIIAAETGVENEVEINSPSRVFMRYGEYMVDGLIIGMKNRESQVKKVAASIANLAAAAMRSALKINSPSKVTYSIGGYMAEGMERGLLDRIRDIENASYRIATAASYPIAAASTSSFNVYNTNNFNTTAARDGTALVRQINRELGSLYYKR